MSMKMQVNKTVSVFVGIGHFIKFIQKKGRIIIRPTILNLLLNSFKYQNLSEFV